MHTPFGFYDPTRYYVILQMLQLANANMNFQGGDKIISVNTWVGLLSTGVFSEKFDRRVEIT